MNSKRRVGFALLLIAAVSAVGTLSLNLVYPVETTVTFDYQHQRYEVSSVTLVAPRFCKFCFFGYHWAPGRYTMAVSLPDGRLMIAEPLWLAVNYARLRDGEMISGCARWFWFDDASNPMEIVAGYGGPCLGTEHSASAPFMLAMVQTAIQRVGVIHLIEAIVADLQSSEADRVVRENPIVPQMAISTSRFFAGIQVAPLAHESLKRIQDADDWSSAGGSCRILFVKTAGQYLTQWGGVWRTAQSRYLILQNGLWSATTGPHRREAAIMYPTTARSPDDSFGPSQLFQFAGQLLHEIHDVEANGKVCKIGEWPPGSPGAFLDFGEGEVFGFGPSLDSVVIRD